MAIDFPSLMVPVVRHFRGNPNDSLSTKDILRWGNKGSLAVKVKEGVWFDHELNAGGGCLDFIRHNNDSNEDPIDWLRKERLIDDDAFVAVFDYRDEQSKLLYQSCRTASKQFKLRRPNGPSGWVWNIKDTRRVLYRLPELLASAGTVFIPEGEKHVDALIKLGLCATCNVGGAGKGKWRKDYGACLRDRDVVVLPDNDVPGTDHADNIARQLTGVARRVRVLMLPGLKPKGDVINWLAAGGTKTELLDLTEATATWEETRSGSPEDGGHHEPPYKMEDDGIYWKMLTKDGPAWIRLSSFTAAITEDVKLDDGSGQVERRFVVDGNLGRAEVAAEKFDGMSWVTREWGRRAVIIPGRFHKEHLAAAIKTLSAGIDHTVFTHLGWRKINGQMVYLHAGGAIGANGPVDGIEVSHLGTLSQFALPPVTDLRTAVRSSLALLDVAPPHIAYPLWGSVYRAPLGAFAPVTVTVWLAGPSGVLKTSAALIAQAHFAPAISARSSANWTSTANANERLAFLAKDSLLLVDDFAPRGTTTEVARMHASAERFIRALANQAGRMRMNPDATLKMEMYPRCGLLGTGEDVPRGHSLRARMIVVEVAAGDIGHNKLTALQRDAESGLPAEAMTGYLAWLACQDHSAFKQRERELRAETTGPHLRTPENIASIMLGIETGMRFAVENGVLDAQESQRHQVEAWTALRRLADAQEHFLRTEAPADRFMSLLASVLSSGRAHVTTTNGDVPLSYREGLGWRVVAYKGGGDTGEPPEPIYREQGRKLGWVDGDYLYLNPDVAYSECQELSRTQNASLEITQGTLWQRLDDAGKIAQKEEGRTTIKRQTHEGRKRTVCLALTDVLDVDEKSLI